MTRLNASFGLTKLDGGYNSRRLPWISKAKLDLDEPVAAETRANS